MAPDPRFLQRPEDCAAAFVTALHDQTLVGAIWEQLELTHEQLARAVGIAFEESGTIPAMRR